MNGARPGTAGPDSTGRRRLTLRRRASRLALVTAAAVLIAGCGGARNSLGTSADPCFRALPPAAAAVNKKGKFIGVLRYSTARLKKRFPSNQKLAAEKAKDLCVIAFKGNFQPADVPLAAAAKPGSYAIVATTIRHPAVVAAFILDHPPARFAHLK